MTFEDMETFVGVFHEAYEFLEEGETSSTYGDSLFKSYRNKPRDVQIHHFIGWSSGRPVSVASIYMSKKDSGLYNVGTPERFKNNGYGTALSVHAINFAKQKNDAKTILLQTELGDDAERLYKNLGFEQGFSAAIWAHDEE